MTDIWALKNLGGLPTVVAFWENNFQGRDKRIFESMKANEFGKVPHSIGCKIPLGTVR